MSEALQKIEPMSSLPDEPRSPQALMRRASDVAGICREIVLKTAVTIQGRKFIRVEGWESIATAHGCFAGAEDAERVYDTQGNHIGYKAKGVLRNARGEVIATGEGFVGFDEHDRKGNPTWKNRDEYAGKAMAQTRAISRTCRGVFAHVVVLMDAGLSTTPAEEVPDGGFDDEQRAAKAKPANVPRRTSVTPATPSTAKPAGSASPSAPPVQASEEQKARWLALLKPLGNAAVEYARHAGWIRMRTDEDDPGEPLEAMSLTHVPATKAAADAILRQIEATMDAQKPAGASGPPSTSAPQGKDAQKPAKAAPTVPQSESDDIPYEFEGSDDGVETIVGKLEAVSVKEGVSKQGPWIRYGLKVGDSWYGTFSKPLGERAQKDKGHTVRIHFKRGAQGNDLVGLERAKTS